MYNNKDIKIYENNVIINLKIIILIYTSRILYNNGKNGKKYGNRYESRC